MGLFLSDPKPWIFVFAPLMITFATSVIFGSFSILFTSTVVILSSTLLMFIFTKKKQKLVKKQSSSERNGGSIQIHDHDYLVRSPDELSGNECPDQGSTPDFSDDGSISDEDSLIEISLPGGQYVGHKLEIEEPNFSIQQTLPDFIPESFFRRTTTLMGLLAELNEMNEEENLIEIDISMGSIKCSRFEIEA